MVAKESVYAVLKYKDVEYGTKIGLNQVKFDFSLKFSEIRNNNTKLTLRVKTYRRIRGKKAKVVFETVTSKVNENNIDLPIMSIRRSGSEAMNNMKPFIIHCSKDILINGDVLAKGFKWILRNGDELKYEKHPDITILFEDRRKLIGTNFPPEIRQQFYAYKHFKEGHTETVYAVQKVRIPWEKFVLKQVNKKALESIPNEATIMMKLKHPNVVDLVKVYSTDLSCFILMEYMEDIDLLTYINNSSNGCLTESSAKFCFYQITQGVKYMHDLNIAHQDLKPENIFVRFVNGKPLCKLGKNF